MVKARELSGVDGLLFWRNSVTGALEAKPRTGQGIELNAGAARQRLNPPYRTGPGARVALRAAPQPARRAPVQLSGATTSCQLTSEVVLMSCRFHWSPSRSQTCCASRLKPQSDSHTRAVRLRRRDAADLVLMSADRARPPRARWST